MFVLTEHTAACAPRPFNFDDGRGSRIQKFENKKKEGGIVGDNSADEREVMHLQRYRLCAKSGIKSQKTVGGTEGEQFFKRSPRARNTDSKSV